MEQWDVKIVFKNDGRVEFLYSDAVMGLFDGEPNIKRASHVEPSEEVPGTWNVTLADIKELGPHAGKRIATNISNRSDALKIEKDFIHRNVLGKV